MSKAKWSTKLCLLLVMGASLACKRSPEAREAEYLKRGEALIAKKDYPRALLEFRNASAAMPRDAEPHYRMGLAYLNSGDIGSAIRSFQRATALNPQHREAQLKMAELMASTKEEGTIKEAVSRLQKAFGDSPDVPEAIDVLALAEWKLGKPEEATKRMEQALQKFPAHLQSSVNLARMKLSKRDWAGAEEVLQKAVASAPQSSAAALVLGELYGFLQQPQKAEQELLRALKLDPQNAGALIGLATLQLAANRTDEAGKTYQRLAALPDKAYKPAHAFFLYRTGKQDVALAEFQALAKADPEDRDARSRLVAAYAGTNRISEAEAVLTAALKRNPRDADALLQRSELLLRAGKTDNAEKDLREVLRFKPDSAIAHYLLAKVYGKRGLEHNQQEEYQQALRLSPQMLAARMELGLSLLAANQAKAGLAAIDGASDSQKKQLAWMIGHNWALLATGNLKEAKASVDDILRTGRPPEVVYQSALIRFVQKDFAGASTQLEELLNSGIVDVRVAQLMMQAYAARQETPKGLAKLKQLQAANPNSASLQYLLGQWYGRTGNSAEEKKAYEAAAGSDAKYMPAALSLAEMAIKEGRYDAARQKLGAVVSEDASNVPALLLLARAEEAAGDRAAVIGRYRSVLAIDSTNVLALNNLAYALAPDNPDEALKFAQQAAEKAPDSPYVQDTLGWVYYRKGLYSMAVRCLKTAVDKEPTPRRQFHLGMSYLKSGDQITGQKLVKDALQKEPNLVQTEQGW